MHVCNTEIPSSKASKLTNKSGICGSTTEVLNILALLKTLTVDSKTAMNYAAELLDTTNDEFSSYQQSQFIAEQLRLALLPSHGQRYSSSLMSIALVWFSISPKLYEDLYHSNLLILPHMSPLRRLTSALNLKEGLDPATVKYLSMRISKLNPKDKLVNIAMDEVYTKQTEELAGGRLYGDSEKGIINTLFCTYISSVAGKLMSSPLLFIRD